MHGLKHSVELSCNECTILLVKGCRSSSSMLMHQCCPKELPAGSTATAAMHDLQTNPLLQFWSYLCQYAPSGCILIVSKSTPRGDTIPQL